MFFLIDNPVLAWLLLMIRATIHPDLLVSSLFAECCTANPESFLADYTTTGILFSHRARIIIFQIAQVGHGIGPCLRYLSFDALKQEL